jgi:hypothetical protein
VEAAAMHENAVAVQSVAGTTAATAVCAGTARSLPKEPTHAHAFAVTLHDNHPMWVPIVVVTLLVRHDAEFHVTSCEEVDREMKHAPKIIYTYHTSCSCMTCRHSNFV